MTKTLSVSYITILRILMSTDTSIEAFNNSFERCMKDELFIDCFYDIFLQSDEEIREKFKNTDMAKQKEMLRVSLYSMMIAHKTPDALNSIAEHHGHNGLKIPAHLFAQWLESLISAVKATDPHFNDDVAAGWRIIMRHGIDYMITKMGLTEK